MHMPTRNRISTNWRVASAIRYNDKWRMELCHKIYWSSNIKITIQNEKGRNNTANPNGGTAGQTWRILLHLSQTCER